MLPSNVRLKPGESDSAAGALTTSAFTSTKCNHINGGLLDML